MFRLKFSFFILIEINFVFSLDNGVARTPPMGWMTWQRFRCNTDCTEDPKNCISENLIKEMADRMTNEGYLQAGYEYIIIDDCWSDKKRDSNDRLVADPLRFPSGIKALADYVHSKGLKFGIYADYGKFTCAGYPGSINHLEIDAKTFAEWTVDYVKLDGCYSSINKMDEGYPLMGSYLNKTNRQIVYSCSWPAYQVYFKMEPNYTKIANHCNLWRNYGDIDDSFESMNDIVQWYALKQDNLALYHKPGSFNDPDMLIIGNYGLSYNQAQAQMALWSILSAPLIMSVDLRDIKPEFEEILKNKNLIRVNQDKLGIMGKRFLIRNGVELWSKLLSDNKTAFVFYNPRPYGTPVRIKVSLENLGLIKNNNYNFYEMFSGNFIGKFNSTDIFMVSVKPSGSVFSFWSDPI